MTHWHTIRHRANEVRRELFAADEPPEIMLDPEEVLGRLEEFTGISRQRVSPRDPLLQKSVALLIPDYEALFYNAELPEWYAYLCQAHEYGHHFLHRGETHCTGEDLNFGGAEEGSVPTGEERVAGYSGRERREREANLFAVEMLLPAPLLRACFIEKGMRAGDLTRLTGLKYDLVCRQLAYALLVSDAMSPEPEPEPDEPPAVPESSADGPGPLELDPGQKRAALTEHSKLLVEAGPGTGKTRTLIGRVLHLLETGVAPDNILALTFSNKAAEEMRARIARHAPEAAPRIWLGTFHAFGLELLRKYSDRAGIERDFELLDPIDGQLLLENHLLELELEHYRDLHSPARPLKDIYNAIQRAKDELAGPSEYEDAARGMLAEASVEEETLAAEKALETARVYRVYEELLAENGWLDLGDLIFRSVLLLRGSPETRTELRSRFRYILVDEFQDVNRASSCLLRELSGEEGNLWIVGDARQTIYRWRGASSANLKLFREDFPGAERTPLGINYRSLERIVGLLSEFAPHVVPSLNDEEFEGWRVPDDRKGSGDGAITCLEAPDFETECEYIARRIRERRDGGRPLREMAVLGRTNTILSKIADELIGRGIPVLYLGNMFERPEIRDLLSLLSLSSGNRGRHLLRLTGFQEYGFGVPEVRRLIDAAERMEMRFPGALGLAANDGAVREDLSAEARDGFARLAAHLSDLEEDTTAWQFLASYLFDRSEYLPPLLLEDSVAVRQQRFAVYQLLQFALSEEDKPLLIRAGNEANPRRRFLRLIRHLAQSGEEAAFRKLPAWAENIDAVRLLTVHGAKGLEFPCVFLPYLGNGYFPNKRQGEPCPLPQTLRAGGGERDAGEEHEEEERCLFFVALSRAEEELFLSRAEQYGRRSRPSPFLELVRDLLPEPVRPEPFAPVDGTGTDLSRALEAEPSGAQTVRPYYGLSELKTYRSCPRRYYYEYVLDLRGDRDESVFFQFHGAVRDVLHWAKNEIASGRAVSPDGASERLREVWADKPASLHPYGPIYLSEADRLVRRTAGVMPEPEVSVTSGVREAANDALSFTLGGKRIRLHPDLVGTAPVGRSVRVKMIKTGRAKRTAGELSDDEKMTLAALHKGAEETFPEKEVEASFEYVASGESFDYDPKYIQTQLNHLEHALEGIAAGRFEPKPSSRNCPRCPHYFLCPGGDPVRTPKKP